MLPFTLMPPLGLLTPLRADTLLIDARRAADTPDAAMMLITRRLRQPCCAMPIRYAIITPRAEPRYAVPPMIRRRADITAMPIALSATPIAATRRCRHGYYAAA